MFLERTHLKNLPALLKMQMNYTVNTEKVLFSMCSIPGEWWINSVWPKETKVPFPFTLPPVFLVLCACRTCTWADMNAHIICQNGNFFCPYLRRLLEISAISQISNALPVSKNYLTSCRLIDLSSVTSPC